MNQTTKTQTELYLQRLDRKERSEAYQAKQWAKLTPQQKADKIALNAKILEEQRLDRIKAIEMLRESGAFPRKYPKKEASN